MVTVEKQSFDRWTGAWRIANDDVELFVPESIGPRVMCFRRIGGENVFKLFPEGERVRGGHRLWVAPERLETTWINDNRPVTVEAQRNGVLATGPVESATGLEKQMDIHLSHVGSAVTVIHRVRNAGVWPVQLAPWALTQMAPGGMAISGFPPRGKHPEALLPSNPLVMWPYTNLGDARFTWLRRYFVLRQGVGEPQKVGTFAAETWGAYLLGGDLFVKRSIGDAGAVYPDMGCSFETFTNEHMLELETLGPLVTLAPGAVAEHIERWSLQGGVELGEVTDEGLDGLPR